MKAAWDRLSDAEKIECWRRGYLFPKLYDYQLPIYKDIWSAILGNNELSSEFFLLCSRRFGKTSIMSLISIEFAIRYPESQIRFACPTQKGLKKIIRPIYSKFLIDCPEDLKPEWKAQDSEYMFPNGSEITASGVNKDAVENLRGQNSHLNLLTEVGFMDNAEYVLRSVLSPQTLTTGGKTIMESTPSDEGMSHESYTIFIGCDASKAAKTRTIYDIDPLPEGFLEKAIKDSGGEHTEHFKREYLCQWVTNSDRLIIPEFDEGKHVRSVEPGRFREFYRNYTIMDLTGGANDKQGHLFGYYDFEKGAIVVKRESEIAAKDVTTETIAKDILDNEKAAFDKLAVHYRWSDNNNLIMLRDLAKEHNLPFSPTSKDSLQAMISKVRVWMSEGRIIIDPSCEMLIKNLKYGIWSKNFKEFARTKDYGHFDLLAALVYFVRNVDEFENPIPKSALLVNVNVVDHRVDVESENQRATVNTLKEIFGVR